MVAKVDIGQLGPRRRAVAGHIRKGTKEMTQQDTAARMTIGAGEFSALCNLFHTVHCDGTDLTAAEAGDILYHDANPFTCDQVRLITRVVLAYLGIGIDIPEADELIRETGAEMFNGHGAYLDRVCREEWEREVGNGIYGPEGAQDLTAGGWSGNGLEQ